MNSNVESMSYVTYEYNVCPKIVEKHTSSNRVQTTINGADIRITLDSISLQPDKSNILYKINILNKGNIIARQLNIIDTLNNISFIEGTLCINGYKIRDHDLKNGFFFKQLNPNDQINISFKVKINTYGDITNIVSGFYYFINDKNEKIYRKILSNLNKFTLNCSHLLFDVKYDNTAMSLNNSKNINIILKNIGNKDAKKAKLNILLPNELKLDYENIFVEEKKVIPNDKYGFFLGNLKENESYNINFNIDFKKFYGRQNVPFAICCSYYNMNEKNLYEKFDSEVLRFSVNLIPNTIR